MYHWKIWYADGSIIEGSTEQDWAACSHENVIVVLECFGRDENNLFLGRINSGCDWYWMENGEVRQSNDSAVTPGEWTPNFAPQGAIVKSGIYVADDVFDAIHAQVIREIES